MPNATSPSPADGFLLLLLHGLHGLQLWESLCWEHLQCPDSKLGPCTACQPCNLQCYWCWKACGASQKMLKPAVPCSYLCSLAAPHGLAPPQITRAATLLPRTAFPLPTIHFFSLLWGVIPWLHSAVWALPTTPLWQNRRKLRLPCNNYSMFKITRFRDCLSQQLHQHIWIHPPW